MNDWNAARDRLLAGLGSGADQRLGVGTEAEVYGLDGDRVLRLCKAGAAEGAVLARRRFYDGLSRDGSRLAVPAILEVVERDGLVGTIEQRISGESLEQALARATGRERETLIEAYVRGALQIRDLGVGGKDYGELLVEPPLVRASWRDFLVARAEQEFEANRGVVGDEAGHAARALGRIGDLAQAEPSDRRSLVHGDYHPGNLFVDGAAGRIGLIDFGALTLAGDPTLDLACSVLNLTGLPMVSPADRVFALKCAQGAGLTDGQLELYRLYYAFRFLGSDRAGLVRWCLTQIRKAG